ncbi:MAG TPA: hypothetical protein VNZ59_15050 [Burkholderiales bacterium]|nr:hypothetical protein [Burkholderiales bacterium]
MVPIRSDFLQQDAALLGAAQPQPLLRQRDDALRERNARQLVLEAPLLVFRLVAGDERCKRAVVELEQLWNRAIRRPVILAAKLRQKLLDHG